MFFNQSGEKENNASTSFFHPTFLIFSIIALSVLFGCFLIQIIVVHFTETENFSKKIFLSVRNSFLAVFIIFLIPFVFWLFNLFIVHLTEAVGYLQTSGNKDRFSSLTRIIYVIGSYEFVNANDIPNNFSPPTSIEN
jgi:Na+/proline symporter